MERWLSGLRQQPARAVMRPKGRIGGSNPSPLRQFDGTSLFRVFYDNRISWGGDASRSHGDSIFGEVAEWLKATACKGRYATERSHRRFESFPSPPTSVHVFYAL